MQGGQNNHGKYQNDYAKQGKMINQYINVPNKYINEAWEKSP